MVWGLNLGFIVNFTHYKTAYKASQSHLLQIINPDNIKKALSKEQKETDFIDSVLT